MKSGFDICDFSFRPSIDERQIEELHDTSSSLSMKLGICLWKFMVQMLYSVTLFPDAAFVHQYPAICTSFCGQPY